VPRTLGGQPLGVGVLPEELHRAGRRVRRHVPRRKPAAGLPQLAGQVVGLSLAGRRSGEQPKLHQRQHHGRLAVLALETLHETRGALVVWRRRGRRQRRRRVDHAPIRYAAALVAGELALGAYWPGGSRRRHRKDAALVDARAQAAREPPPLHGRRRCAIQERRVLASRAAQRLRRCELHGTESVFELPGLRREAVQRPIGLRA